MTHGIAVLMIIFGSLLAAQTPERNEPVLSPLDAHTVKGETLDVRFAGAPKCFHLRDARFDDRETLSQFMRERCPDEAAPNVDFSKETLVAASSPRDCHGRVRIEVFRDDEAKQFLLEIVWIDGGCRAMQGDARYWLVLPKVPDDYTLRVEHLREDQGWLYPVGGE